MSKEERYTYHCDQYDYVEIIYDNEECEEIDSMKMAEKRLNRQQDKISDLEAKLAEKDDELLQKEKKIQDLMLCEFVATTLDFNKLSADNCKLREQLAEHNQDKISFAVEQLEKVKEIINTYNKEHCFLSTEIDTCNKSVEIIDNQIKQLKEGK